MKKGRVRETYGFMCAYVSLHDNPVLSLPLHLLPLSLLFALICPAGRDSELIVYFDKLKGEAPLINQGQ